jgi:hypothetical protein
VTLIVLGMLGFIARGSRLLLAKQVPLTWVRRLGVLRVSIVGVFALGLLQPVVSFPYTAQRPPEVIVLVDTSRSMSLAEADGNGTRLDEVRAYLQEREFRSALDARFRAHWFAFDRTAYPLEAEDLERLEARGDSTHFADALRAAWSVARPIPAADSAAGPAPARLLLVSDGNDLGESDIVEFARQQGIVIDTLAPRPSSTTSSAAGVVIAQVQCAPRVLLGSETQFRVTVRGQSPGLLRLLLSEDGKEVASRDLAPNREETHVVLVHRPATLGLKNYQIRLEGNGVIEQFPYSVSVQVADAKHQVLILEDTWRYEFKYLRRVLEDDPSFSYTAMLARSGGAFVHFGEPDRRVNLGGFPQGREQLSLFDTIVLGDADPRRWPRGLAPALVRSIADDGKALVVIAGPNLAQLADVPSLHALLPVQVSRASGTPVEGPIDVRLTTEGARSPLFFSPATAKEPSAFAQLSPVDQVYPVLRKRPAATILLEASRQANDYGNLIVMAEHTVGRGRVLFVATDTLWKWHTLGATKDSKVTPYIVFWQQALRALAPIRPGSGPVNVWLQPERTRYEAGQRIRVWAEIHSQRPLVQPALQAAVVLPDERRLPLAFAPDPANPRMYRAEFDALAPGQYRLAASVLSEGKLAGEVSTALDVESPRAELASGRIDEANLARITSATGGQRVIPADATTWPVPVGASRVAVREIRSLDLWNNFSLLLVLSGLLGVDWFIRLMRGYV